MHTLLRPPNEDAPTRKCIPQGSFGSEVLTSEYEAFLDGGAIEITARVSRENADELLRDGILEKLPCA